jgi:hypothetical protein
MLRLTGNRSISALAPAQFLLLSGALLLTGSHALAEDREDTLPTVTVGTTGTAVSIDEDGSDTGQFNFEIELAVPARAGSFSLLLEAGAGRPEPLSCAAQTTGDFHAFAAGFGDARVVEFSYRVSHHTGDWAVGFQEARSTIDTSRVANDDKTQFLGPAFVNNPTISLPGSTVGLSWQRAIGTGRRGIGAAATRYEHSGAFLAAESWWAFDRTIARIGAWQGRAEVGCEEHPHESSHGHGLYTSVDGQTTLLQWNLRAGWGRHGEVPVSFIGLAVELPLANGTLGLALGQGRVANHEEAARERHAEMYYRYSLPGGLTILPGFQLSDRRDDGSGPDLAVGFRFGIGI